MSGLASKREQALEACEKVINGIEDGAISVTSSLLLCKKIARLVNDVEGQEWLGYEYGGYPRADNGHILHDAWEIGAKHGRSYQSEDKDGKRTIKIFTELCGELESGIESDKKAINNYTTQGYSVSGSIFGCCHGGYDNYDVCANGLGSGWLFPYGLYHNPFIDSTAGANAGAESVCQGPYWSLQGSLLRCSSYLVGCVRYSSSRGMERVPAVDPAYRLH